MTDTTTTLDLVRALLKVAEVRHANATASRDAATALPKGTRGKASAIKAADAERQAAFAALTDLRRAITEANRPGVMAWLAALCAEATDPVVRTLLDAGTTSRRRDVALDLSAYSFGKVYASVSLSASGFPQYVEIRRLADRAERLEQATRWLAQATTPEGKAQAEAILADPDAFPYYSGKTSTGSITVGEAWQHGENEVVTFTLNASTWQAETDDEARDAWRLVGAAEVVRRKLNAMCFPSASVIRNRLDAVA